MAPDALDDARLIAAAPCLLAACKRMLDSGIVTGHSGTQEMMLAVARAESA